MLIKIKFVSIRLGLTRIDINGKIEATPITSINAIIKIINNKIAAFFFSSGESMNNIFFKICILFSTISKNFNYHCTLRH